MNQKPIRPDYIEEEKSREDQMNNDVWAHFHFIEDSPSMWGESLQQQHAFITSCLL